MRTAEHGHSIEEIRTSIDHVDREIVALLAKRGRLVHQAARFKKTADDVKAPQRVAQVVAAGVSRGLMVLWSADRAGYLRRM